MPTNIHQYSVNKRPVIICSSWLCAVCVLNVNYTSTCMLALPGQDKWKEHCSEWIPGDNDCINTGTCTVTLMLYHDKWYNYILMYCFTRKTNLRKTNCFTSKTIVGANRVRIHLLRVKPIVSRVKQCIEIE